MKNNNTELTHADSHALMLFMTSVHFALMCEGCDDVDMDAAGALGYIRESIANLKDKLGTKKFNDLLAEEGMYGENK